MLILQLTLNVILKYALSHYKQLIKFLFVPLDLTCSNHPFLTALDRTKPEM